MYCSSPSRATSAQSPVWPSAPTGSLSASSSRDCTVKVWDLTSNQEVLQLQVADRFPSSTPSAPAASSWLWRRLAESLRQHCVRRTGPGANHPAGQGRTPGVEHAVGQAVQRPLRDNGHTKDTPVSPSARTASRFAWPPATSIRRSRSGMWRTKHLPPQCRRSCGRILAGRQALLAFLGNSIVPLWTRPTAPNCLNPLLVTLGPSTPSLSARMASCWPQPARTRRYASGTRSRAI